MGDLISRQAVQEAITISIELKENPHQMWKRIQDLSSAEKTGHWKRISIDKYSEHAKYWYRCDRCGKDNLGNTDWCPNCGARMESEG